MDKRGPNDISQIRADLHNWGQFSKSHFRLRTSCYHQLCN